MNKYQAYQAFKDSQDSQDFQEKQACVFLLVFYEQDKIYILAIQKADSEGYPWRNQIALPGGHVDKQDKSLIDAAFRELYEELNIPKQDVKPICSMGEFQTINKVKIEAFLGIWNKNSQIIYDKSEISGVFEVSLNSLLEIHKANNYANRLPSVFELKYPVITGEKIITIWGVTAKILHRFIENHLSKLLNLA